MLQHVGASGANGDDLVVGKHLCRSREVGMCKIEKTWECYIIDIYPFYHCYTHPLKRGSMEGRSSDLGRLKIELIQEMYA